MRFIHLADLHLGRRISGYSLLEDQADILDKIMMIIDEEKPDLVIIAGDVYDKLIPPAEAVTLFDGFLTQLAEKKIETFIIAGNHDSAQRIAYGANIMNRSGIHFSPVYDGRAAKFTVTDEFGKADIYLLPFLRAAEVRRFFPDEDIRDTAAAVRTAIKAMDIDKSRRNVIVSHQFVDGGKTSDSERGEIGGTDSVPAEVYEEFDYAALGHLHMPQKMTSEKIRYGGTPLKYSISEEYHKKCVTVCELGAKGEPVRVTLRELESMHDMYTLTGSFEELMKGSSEDYVQLNLTDERRVSEARNRLKTVYPNMIGMRYLREEDLAGSGIELSVTADKTDPAGLFEAFFEESNKKKMDEEQRSLIRGLVNEIWGEAK